MELYTSVASSDTIDIFNLFRLWNRQLATYNVIPKQRHAFNIIQELAQRTRCIPELNTHDATGTSPELVIYFS